MLDDASIQRLVNTYAIFGGRISYDNQNLRIFWPKPSQDLADNIELILAELKNEGISPSYDPNSMALSFEINDTNREQMSAIAELLDDVHTVSAPKIDTSTTITYSTVASSKISERRILLEGDNQPPDPEGRILFRGDNQPPEQVFKTGFKPKRGYGGNIMDGAYASRQGDIIALTPYFNTAAIFPIEDSSTSSTWVYIVKIDKGIPIATASLFLKKSAEESSASYPAEVVTAAIPPKKILCAVEIKRNWVTGSRPSRYQPSGNFKISRILYNNASTINKNDKSLENYLKYLEDCREKETVIPFALSENVGWKTQKSFPSGLGLQNLSSDLKAQNSQDYPAQAIEAWMDLFSKDKKIDRENIEKVAFKYPKVINILNADELRMLLSHYSHYEVIPSMMESPFFMELKKSALVNILKNADSYSTPYVLTFFMRYDLSGEFSDCIKSASTFLMQTLNFESCVKLLQFLEKLDRSNYEKILLEMINKKLQNQVPRKDYEIVSYLEVICHVLAQDRSNCELYKPHIQRILKTYDDINLPEIIENFARENSSQSNTDFFKMLIKEIQLQKPPDLFAKIVSPAQGKNPEPGGRRIISPIISAIKAGNIELVKFWIENGASLRGEFTPTNRNTPLMTAIRYNQPDIALMILNSGDSDHVGLDMKNQQKESVKDLVSKKANDTKWDEVRQKVDQMSRKPSSSI